MPSKSVAPRFQIQWKICRARKRGSPRAVEQRLERVAAQFGKVGPEVALHGYLTRHVRLARRIAV